MPGKITTQGLTPFGSLMRDHFEKGAELAKKSQGFSLSRPATGNSGYAVGWAQRDLSKAKQSEFNSIMNVLNGDPVLAGHGKKLTDILKERADKLSPSDHKFVDQLKGRITQRLSSAQGRAVVEEISAAQAKRLEQKVNDLAAKAGPLAKGFMNSVEGKLRIADYLNQFGLATERLEPFLQGKEVKLNNGRNRIKLDRPMTVEKWRDYVGATKHGANRPADVDRRFRETDNTLKRQNIKPDAPRRKAPPAPKPGTATPKPGSPAPKPGGGARAPAEQDGGASAAQQAAAQTGDNPEIRNFLNFATRPPEGAEAILLKRPERVTEDEMMALIRRPGYERDPARNDAVRNWHLAFFGDGPIPRDASGRQINAPPIRPLPRRPSQPMAADGGDLVEGVRRIADTVAQAAQPNLDDGVKRLQRTLNALSLQHSADRVKPLAIDGAFGPATRGRLQQEVAGIGVRRLQDAFLKSRA